MADAGQVQDDSASVPTWAQEALALGKLIANPTTATVVASVLVVFAGEPEDARLAMELRSSNDHHDARALIAREVGRRLRAGTLSGERARAAFLTVGMLAALESADARVYLRAEVEHPSPAYRMVRLRAHSLKGGTEALLLADVTR